MQISANLGSTKTETFDSHKIPQIDRIKCRYMWFKQGKDRQKDAVDIFASKNKLENPLLENEPIIVDM
jgi:hypothetical protein